MVGVTIDRPVGSQTERGEDPMSNHHTDHHTFNTDTHESLYEYCITEIKKCLEQTATLTAEVFQTAAYAVRDRLAPSMGGRQEELNQVIETLVKQWERVLTHGEQFWKEAQGSDVIQNWTDQGVSFLAQLAGTIKTLAGEVESRLQHEQEYHTGTIVSAGNFFCIQCDKEVRKVKTGPLPPCSRCHGTIFRRRM